MREPEYVLQKAQTRYRDIWRDALLGTDSGAYAVTLDPPPPPRSLPAPLTSPPG